MKRLARLLVWGFTTMAATAQCTTQWLPGNGALDTNGEVNATRVWDPDGPGPRSPVLVVGGAFTTAGDVVANGVATYDPAFGTWGTLGQGLSPFVYDLAVSSNGELFAGGSFVAVGTAGVANVARWDGTQWRALGTGTDAAVFSLTALPGGELVAGGLFNSAGGVACNHVARWNGSQWAPLGAGTDGGVVATAVLPNGVIVVGGFFDVAGGVPVGHCAQWNGSAWSSLASGTNSYVFSLAVTANGDLLAGGAFSQAGGASANNVARWNGSAWSAIGGGVPFAVQELQVAANGEVLAVGFTQLIGAPAPLVRRWNGAAWLPSVAGPETGLVNAIAELPGGDLVAAGLFTLPGSSDVRHLARWNGAVWSTLHAGTNGAITAIAPLPGGGCYVAGPFTTIAGVAAHHVARWDGSQWSALGTGTNFPPATLLVLPNGDLVVGGNFTQAGSVVANGIARWNGSSWSSLGSGVNGYGVRALCLLPDGTLVAGGDFDIAGGLACNRVALWNGVAWAAMAQGMDDRVSALTLRDDGLLVAGGRFVHAGGWQANHLAFWDGANWGSFGTGPLLGTDGEVFALVADGADGVFVGGAFTMAGGVASPNLVRATLTTFDPLPGPDGAVRALHRLPDGDVVVAGAFDTVPNGGTTLLANHVVRWDGNSWTPFDQGADGIVTALASAANGDLLLGGDFARAGPFVSRSFARLTTTCPAIAAAAGVGCIGPSGQNRLDALTLPWTGSTFRARATGVPPFGLVVIATGSAPWALPLSSLLAPAMPGCQLLLQPDLDLALWQPTGNVLDVALQIPDTSSLANVLLHQQVVAFDVTATGAVTAITSSNALRLLVGTL